MTVATLFDWIGYLRYGLEVTLQLSVVTTLFGVVLAAALALARLSPSRLLRALARLEVDLLRSIPLLALLLFMYFGVGPAIAKFGVNEFWLAVIALTLSESAYLAEVYRAALEAVPPTQWEAATSLGMGWAKIMRHVIVPQAVLPSIPTTVNALIAIIKDSSLASLIGVGEMTLTATILVSKTFQPLEVYLVLMLVYLALIGPLGLLAAYLERVVERRIGALGVRVQTAALDIAPELAASSTD